MKAHGNRYGSETWALTLALQDKMDWMHLPHTIHGSCNQCHRMTPSRLTIAADSVHPDQTASILWTHRGKDGYVTISLEHSRAVQGLEASSRMSSSYLYTHPGCRSPASQLWSQLSMEIRSGSRTLETPRGNRYMLPLGAYAL